MSAQFERVALEAYPGGVCAGLANDDFVVKYAQAACRPVTTGEMNLSNYYSQIKKPYGVCRARPRPGRRKSWLRQEQRELQRLQPPTASPEVMCPLFARFAKFIHRALMKKAPRNHGPHRRVHRHQIGEKRRCRLTSPVRRSGISSGGVPSLRWVELQQQRATCPPSRRKSRVSAMQRRPTTIRRSENCNSSSSRPR